MATFIHSILSSNHAIAADGDELFDLPVNPLSVILLHLNPLNETSTITTYRYLTGLLAGVTNIRITHKGAAVFDASGADAAYLAMIWHRMQIWQSNASDDDNERRSVVIPIIFGRRAYDGVECFPATKKGEFQMNVTFDVAAAGFDGMRVSVETVELPDATPTWVEKATTLATTFAATGQNEIDLPIGNGIRGILCHGNTPFVGAAPAPTLGRLEVLRDNVQIGYSQSDFEVLRGLGGATGRLFPPDGQHLHGVNAAGAGEEDTREPMTDGAANENYCLLDYDPMDDDQFILETSGAGRMHIRINAETADAARFLPIERVDASSFT